MRHVWLLIALWGGAESRVPAYEGSLAECVGTDAALYVEVRDLDRYWQTFEQSPYGQRCRSSPFYGEFWNSAFGQKWQLLDAHVASVTGASFTTHLRQLFGEALALALYLPAEGPPRGILISRALSEEALERALWAWDRLEPPARVDRKNTGGGIYYRRLIRKGDTEQVLYYARRERLFLLSDHEHLIRDCLDRARDQSGQSSPAFEKTPATPATNSLATLPEFMAMRARWQETSFVTVFLQPRCWDAALQRELDPDQTGRPWMQLWKSLRACGASCAWQQGLQVELSMLLDESRLSSEWRAFASDVQWPSAVKLSFPQAQALLCARFSPRWLMMQWLEVLSPSERENLAKTRRMLTGLLQGQDLFQDVAPAVLADWCLVLQRKPSASDAPGWWEDWALTFLAWPATGWSTGLREGIDNALQFAANALAAHHNQQSEGSVWSVTRSETPSGTYRVLKTTGGFNPALGWLEGRWGLSTHEDVLRHYLSQEGEVSEKPRRLLQEEPAQVFAWCRLDALRGQPLTQSWPELVRFLMEIVDEGTLTVRWTETEVRVRVELVITSDGSP